jgi:hypothetical protein
MLQAYPTRCGLQNFNYMGIINSGIAYLFVTKQKLFSKLTEIENIYCSRHHVEKLFDWEREKGMWFDLKNS